MRANIEIDTNAIINAFGTRALAEAIIDHDPNALAIFCGDRSTVELAELLKKTLAPEALAELKTALG